MSHWRRTPVWWTLGLGVVVVALGLGGPPQAAAQNPCEGFSGVCRGQCDAALDQGCFENPDTRQCGKREEQWEFHACPGTPPWALKRVFVTSTLYPGNLGGLAGADAKCQDRADAAGLDGTFKAWLSTTGPGNSAAERLTKATVPYVRVDGVQVAEDFDALVDGMLEAPIAITESGAAINGINVWTGTTPTGGSSGSDCQGWSNGSFGVFGTTGASGASDANWTMFTPVPVQCLLATSLYCIEQ